MKGKWFQRVRGHKAAGILLAAALLLGSIWQSPSAVNAANEEAAGKIQAEFFVSPTGDDSNPGTYEAPFASLEAARQAVAKINQDMTGDIYVFLLPGTYYVTETVTFDVADSGTNGYEVIYKTLGDAAAAKLAGGIRVESDWVLVEASADPAVADSDLQQELVGKIYKTNLKEQLDETFGEGNWPATSGPLPLDENGKFTVNTITVNDTRATLARTLNSEKYDSMPATMFENPLYTAGGGNVDMTYKAADEEYLFVEQLSNAQARGDLSAQIVCNDIGGRRAWDSDTLPITAVDADAHKLTFNPNNVGDFAPLYTIGSESRYFLQGNLAFLDTPGEFYYNPQTYDLYYYPMEGEEDLSRQDIIVPTTDQVIRLEGERTGIWDDTEITPVSNITFDGLKFSDTAFPDYYSSGWPWLPYAAGAPGEYYFPEWALDSTNPVYCGANERPQFQVGTVTLKYTDQISLRNCQVKNAAMNGIELYLGVTNTRIDNCLVEYCGNGGIMIEGGYPGVDGNSDAVSYTNNNTVSNTVVHDVGQLVHQTFGIQVSHATYNTVTNCEIYHSPRRGLLLVGSDVNGWNNTASGNRNWAPVAYDVTRDEYAHGNTFSNIYLHDVQQDGGDDGGLFTVFVYYAHHNFSRPNTFDQIVIDEVAANPSMGDIAPNNINLDMGWCGVEMSNVKTVNPQHYTIENSNLQNGQVKVDNCTFYFANEQDGLADFDDSRMDYANIGVQAWRYPEAFRDAITGTSTQRPQDCYFEEDFEQGLDLTKWSYSGSMPKISRIFMSEGPFNGKASLVLNNTGTSKPVLYKEFEDNLNKIVTVKIFDRQLSPGTTYSGAGHLFPDTGTTLVRVDDGTDENVISMGIDTAVATGYYVVNIGGVKTATSVERIFGWHELTFDYTQPGTVTLSIDGTEVGTAARECFDYIALGSEDATGENYYDQLYVYGGGKDSVTQKTGEDPAQDETGAGDPEGDKDPGDLSRKESETWIDWKFEDDSDVPYHADAVYGTPFVQAVSGAGTYGGSFESTTMIDFFNTTFSVTDNPSKTEDNSSDKVLARSGQGGCHTYAPQEPPWQNYVWEFDYLYKSSTPVEQQKGNSVSFIVYSQNTAENLGTAYPYQPMGYWFCINEEQSALQIRKATAQKGVTDSASLLLDEIKLDDEEMAAFTDTEKWHDIRITALTSAGSTIIQVSVDDCAYELSAADTSNPFTGGTFAINVMESDFYMDNIRITGIGDSPLTGYDTDFKLGNAVLDQDFSADCRSYIADIVDIVSDVTLVKPDCDGGTYRILLNGTDMTEQFPDTVTPVALPLIPGNNTLVVEETTELGIVTEYVFAIYKDCTLVSAEIPSELTIPVGTMPDLPSEVRVVVNDGKQDYDMNTAVVWEMADQSLYKAPGQFVVQGSLTELDKTQLAVTVKVEGIRDVEEPAAVEGTAGEDPASLLADTVALRYEHAGIVQAEIAFKSFAASVYAEEGMVVAVGRAQGYDGDVLQLVKLIAAAEPEEPEPADKEALKGLVAEADKIDLSKYTEKTAEELREALKAAKDILADETLTTEDQALVDSAAKTLEEAIDGLAAASPGGDDGQDDGSQGGQGGDDGGQDDGSQGGQDGNNDGQDDGNIGTNDGNTGTNDGNSGKDDGKTDNAPGKTGDGAPVFIWIAAALLTLCAGASIILKVRMRREE